MTNQKRLTIREVSERIGYSKSTISMALRGDPGIPKSTQKTIREACAQLGYFPDPKITKLMSHLSLAKTKSGRGTLALISQSVPPGKLRETWYMKAFYANICARAESYGYHVEYFLVSDREGGLPSRRIASILKARGIEGIIFLPTGGMDGTLSFDISSFSCVTCANQFEGHRFNCIWPDFYSNALLAFEEINKLGYRRPGLVLHEHIESPKNHKTESAYLWCVSHGIVRESIPPFRSKDYSHEGFDLWLKTYKPDMVISAIDITLYNMIDLGYKVPGDMGYAMLMQTSVRLGLRERPDVNHERISGIDTLPEVTDAATVDTLVAMINRGERGIPEVPQNITFQGKWRHADTTRTQTSDSH